MTALGVTVADLLSRGPLRRIGRSVHVFDSIESTNAFLLERCESLIDGSVAYAEHQTRGRGRLGRSWDAPAGSSVMLSVLLIEREAGPLIALSSRMAAVAACEAIERETRCRPRLRWPNDLMHADRKLGGVLVETSPLSPGAAARRGRAGMTARAVVIGIGINCSQSEEDFDASIAGKATSLRLACGEAIDRVALAARLLERLDAIAAADCSDAGVLDAVREAWLKRCGDVGQRITLVHNGNRVDGVVEQISRDGDLILRLDSSERKSFGAATTTRSW